jgi:hypothetical protein
MKNRLHWFIHDVVTAMIWAVMFVGYYFTKACDFVGKMLFGDIYDRR